MTKGASREIGSIEGVLALRVSTMDNRTTVRSEEDQLDLGTIHPVSLRELWAGEATDFTPWLAKNLDVLGAQIGIDIELDSTETAVGDFPADITARDISTNKLVVVENQYGATDHRHPEQIITYASELGAGAVVWIAETIRPEHKSAIDFLNQNLKEGSGVSRGG